MNCKNPYIAAPNGTDLKGFSNSKAVRTAITPHPCGQCMACRIAKAREWTVRMQLEQMDSSCSSFLTLTYDDDKLPLDDHGTPVLQKQDLIDFLKRLRYYKDPVKLRHFAVGEYGDKYQRPHYHLALFGLDQFEQTPVKKAWHHGFTHLIELNKDTIRYATGYILKNLKKTEEEGLYERPPEFMLSSRGTRNNQLGGLGRNAVRRIADNYKASGYPIKKIIRTFNLRGNKYPLGKYLTRKLADDLGINQSQWEKETACYQLELCEKHMKGGNYYQNILKPSYQKAINIEKKAEIFKQKRKL